ncbi:protein kinase domain-containing protein, partial [Listeria monocytogenes]|uniref:protein kinase domain-containing protein n=1 Tax=Listeria monocytogenes TaxID=1639 RepID=UPI003FA48C52
KDRALYHTLRSEAQLLAQLNHPNIVRAWDFEDDPRRPFLVMEFVDGPNLHSVLQKHGRLPTAQALKIVRD